MISASNIGVKLEYVFYYESGRLHDNQEKVIIMVGIYLTNYIQIENNIKIIKTRSKKDHKNGNIVVNEIKFSSTGNKTRTKILQSIHNLDIKIYILIINKDGRTIKDTPYNYALLTTSLLHLIKTPNNIKYIIVDKHFSNISQRDQYNFFYPK